MDVLSVPRLADLTDEQVLQRYAPPDGPAPWVRFNFVSSLDGAATLRGRSGGLGDESDRRVLVLLRRPADVVLVGAGTIRVEGYAGDLLDGASRAWRLEQGLSAHPPVAVVSARPDLDPASGFFTEAVVRPLVVTTARADPARRQALERVADVVVAGEDRVDPVALVRALAERGHRRIHSEGGPMLFGSFQQAGAVDELCLSLSPVLVGGPSRRIAVGTEEHLRRMRLASVLLGGDLLLLRYLAADSAGAR
jgi:riboflavin biosynthesis pyrimidine reductase